MSTVHQRIREERKSTGLTQKDLAKHSGLDQSYISRLEKGEKVPGCDTAQEIARALGIPTCRLLGEEPERSTNLRAELSPRRKDPEGLRELAEDAALMAVLGITPGEWRTLRSIQLPAPTAKAGYVQLLHTIRAVSPA
ncbi:MAG: helix-turn-helix domain-containing protein [Thiohalorhabdaceae bacterium]